MAARAGIYKNALKEQYDTTVLEFDAVRESKAGFMRYIQLSVSAVRHETALKQHHSAHKPTRRTGIALRFWPTLTASQRPVPHA